MAPIARRTTSAQNPYIIASPKLGMLNLIGGAAQGLLDQDRASLGSLFSNNVEVSTQTVPTCNVLFLYCTLDAAGRVAGCPFSLRDAIKTAGAHVAVVASETPTGLMSKPDFGKSLSAGTGWPANVVITLNRNGAHFGEFFRALFTQMQAGVTMPLAWVALAPQGPVQRTDIPATVCLMQAGHISFARRAGAAG